MIAPATPTTTNAVAPLSMPAVNTANLAMKPLVSGIPARANSRKAKVPATSGLLRPRPAHCARCVASPLLSLTSVTTAKEAIVVKP